MYISIINNLCLQSPFNTLTRRYLFYKNKNIIEYNFKAFPQNIGQTYTLEAINMIQFTFLNIQTFK